MYRKRLYGLACAQALALKDKRIMNTDQRIFFRDQGLCNWRQRYFNI